MGTCENLVDKALVIDMYGRPFYFMLPNLRQKYKSIIGSVCTIFVLAILLAYAIYKFQLLMDKGETRVSKVL